MGRQFCLRHAPVRHRRPMDIPLRPQRPGHRPPVSPPQRSIIFWAPTTWDATSFSRIIYGCRIAVMVAFRCGDAFVHRRCISGGDVRIQRGQKDRLLHYLVVRYRSFVSPDHFGPGHCSRAGALAVQRGCRAGLSPPFPFYGRVARAQTLSVKEADYVKAAEAMGLTRLKIILRHITPNIMAPVIVCLGYGHGHHDRLGIGSVFPWIRGQAPHRLMGYHAAQRLQIYPDLRRGWSCGRRWPLPWR